MTQTSASLNRILIVDDQPDNLRLLSKMLIDHGYEIRRAVDGETALMGVQARPPDLILLDINMPGLSGYEVCQRLKAEPQTRLIPVIFLSASNDVVDKVKAFEMGGVDYITKPFQVPEVLARVATQLQLKRVRDLRENLSRMIVHDLRNPLSGIAFASSSLLRKEGLAGQEKEVLETIYANAQRLDSMLNDLLLAAKIDAGALVLHLSTFDIHELVTAVSGGFMENAAAKKIHLLKKMPEQAPLISGDENLVKRAIENLLLNAIKFSPVGSQIILEINSVSSPQMASSFTPQTEVRVIDQGIGVSEAMRQQIFEPFVTGELVEGVSQIGLGLSFCKMVAEAHGGKILVEDNHPQGAIFTLQI